MPYIRTPKWASIADRAIMVSCYAFIAHLAGTQIDDGAQMGSEATIILASIMLLGAIAAGFGAMFSKYQIEWPATYVILAGVFPLTIFVWAGYINGRHSAAVVDLTTLLFLGMMWRLLFLHVKARKARVKNIILTAEV